jgi:predicted metal-dependent phosphoesterase TrpH
MHTVHSDGTLTTRELLARAQAVGLTTISITDHDSTNAIPEALALGKEFGIEIIAGTELSASYNSLDIHILGYFIDHTDIELQSYLEHYRKERLRRAERIVEKLNDLNVPLTLEAVLERAGTGSVGRPHIAHALVEEGLTQTYHEAFFKYIGFGKPAYEEKFRVSPREAMELISASGGLSFIAHPGNSLDENVIMELIKQGIDGLEVVHPSHSPERVAYYRAIAREYFLLTSGGSDFHGGRRNDAEALGKYTITDDDIEMMRHRLA